MQFHLVFDTLMISRAYYDVFEAIKNEIVKNAEQILLSFDLSYHERYCLRRLARSDRKYFRVHKEIGKANAQKAYAKLLSAGWLYVEPTLEVRPKRDKRQKLPRHQRRKLIQDKIHFSSHFVRFFFYFIEPKISEILSGEIDAVMGDIRAEFDAYCSLGFERLGAELLALDFGLDSVPTSLWIDRTEIDICAINGSNLILGEAKYQARKVCKSVLTQLEKKCTLLGLIPDIIALISLNGFSKELINLKDKRLRLYDIDDFKRLLNE